MLFQLTPSAMPEGYGEALLPLVAAKAWLGVYHDDQDALIEALRDAGVDMTERYTSRYLAPREGLVIEFAGFGAGMRIPYGPAPVVTGIAYLDADGAEASIADGEWRVGVGGCLLPALGARWPVSSGTVSVTFDAGYAAGACPDGLLTAAKMFMSHLWVSGDAIAAEGLEGKLPGGFVAVAGMFRAPVI